MATSPANAWSRPAATDGNRAAVGALACTDWLPAARGVRSALLCSGCSGL